MKMKKSLVLTFLAAVLISVSGCEDNPNEPTALAIVVGAHANALSPNLQTADIQQLLTEACKSYATIYVTTIEGEPRTSTYAIHSTGKALTEAQLDKLAVKQTTKITQAIEGIQATSPEVDILAAIHQGARSLADVAENQEVTMLILSTGLSTTGILDFTKPDIIDSDADNLTEQLIQQRALPNLENVHVIFYGLGDIAKPQTLTYEQRESLRTIWHTILIRAGARSVTFKEALQGIPRNADMPFVTVIDFPEANGVSPDILPEEGLHFGEERFSFIGDSAEFVDPAAAREQLQVVSRLLINSSETKVLIAGTTASGNSERCFKLSSERANAVKQILLEEGVSASQIETIGLGFERDPWRVSPDRNENGTHNDKAKLNRKVVILSQTSTAAQKIMSGEI